ncbi:MAG: EAL domain-containing protein [Lachnospiraceae bacterium]|nr:EAL domain-containing protein [Lachnospiraceae bacterium]
MRVYSENNGTRSADTLLRNMRSLVKTFFPDAQVSCENNESFCVITRDVSVEEKIDKIAKGVRLLGGITPVLLKAGIYLIPRDEDPPVSELLSYARIAESFIHYEDGVLFRYYDDELKQIISNREYIRKHLEEAIQNGELKVYYQPIIRTLNGCVIGYEALTRWEDPKLGFLSPKEFISAIEESRQISILDTYMIRKICKDLREGLDKGIQIQSVSFNLSRLDFHLSDVFAVVENAVKEFAIDRSYLNIEITEKILSESELIRLQIRRFTEAGYKVWVDDFGRGYSSLNTLKEFDFDKLKIDMNSAAFHTDQSGEIIIATVTAAKRLGIRTLAEGVETKEQFEFLRSIGCEEVQGYYISKPLPLDEVGPFLNPKGILPEEDADTDLFVEAGRTDISDKRPCSLLVLTGGRFKLLYMNRSCERLLAEVLGNEKSLDKKLNDAEDRFYHLIRNRISLCKERGGDDCFVLPIGSGTLVFRLRILSQNADKAILKIRLAKAELLDIDSGN